MNRPRHPAFLLLRPAALGCLLLGVFGASPLAAQGEPTASSAPRREEPPAPPLVAPPAAAADWEMKIAAAPPPPAPAGSPARTEAPAPAPVSVRITALNGLRRVVVTRSDQSREEIWQTREGVTLRREADGRPRVQWNTAGYEPYPFASAGFFGLEPVSAGNFRGTVSRRGVPCHRYAADDEAPPPKVPGAVAREHPETLLRPPARREVWIAAERRLPVTTTGSFGTIEYTFHEAPSSLELPADLRAALDEDRRGLEKLRRRGR